MVQTLPNLANPLAVAELENVLGLGAGVALRGPLPDAALAVALLLQLGLALLRSARQGFSFGVQGCFLELVFASLAHFQTFPTVQSWAMRPFARPAVFGEPT
jgi:hypothetical protein